VNESEEALLQAIRRVLSEPSPNVVLGPGDDAAVLSAGSGDLLLTTDALVEDVHFSRRWITARELGAKAINVSVSDIAAMAGSPRAAVCALALPAELDAAWAMQLLGGMREACGEHGLALVGGNLAAGPCVQIVVTVLGEVAPGRAVPRSGARAGNRVVVTGDLGGSAAGLRLARGSGALDAEGREAVARHLRPRARVGEGAILARHGATAMIDVSDGLAVDLTRVCDAAGVGVRLRLADVPLGPAAEIADALAGGEDYELVATMPDDGAVDAARAELRETFGVPLTAIGEIVDEGRSVIDAAGLERPLEPAGWDHFA
jgi:thiamine-monophosphate kinase